MKILVCARIGNDGEINPFDACAYELALSCGGNEVVLLSMGPESSESALSELTRLGADTAYLLSDPAFAGADTLATAYTLSLAVKRIKPDLIFCGRQTLIGDTAQTAVMLAQKAGFGLITNVMSVKEISDSGITCTTRDEGELSADLPALITVERINTLRLPSIRSRVKAVNVLSAADLEADKEKCGLKGSPTRVIDTKENTSGRRKCEFITPDRLTDVINAALKKRREGSAPIKSKERLSKVLCVTKTPYEYAKTVSDNVVFCDTLTTEAVIAAIKTEDPDAVLFGSDSKAKRVSATVAATLSLGLCADCTALKAEEGTLLMIRPALSGSVIATVKSITRPAMATVRTAGKSDNIVVAAGYGARDCLDGVKAFADRLGATLAASRKAVDNDILPYNMQVGLTGKTVSPDVYIAVGVSGAVHHIVGMDKSGTVIAINPDRQAQIFDYADFGIVSEFQKINISDGGKI